jgi:hypothetical protein
LAIFSGCGGKEIVAPHTGNLKIDVSPDGIGASWVIEKRGKAYSGAEDTILVDVPEGKYALTWQPVQGWNRPSPDPVEVRLERNTSQTISGTYTPVNSATGTLVIDATPDEIAAPWSLTGPDSSIANGTGDASLEAQPVGEYELTWGSVDGYSTPDPQTSTLEANGTVVFAGTYVRREVPLGTIVVDPNPNSINAPWTVEGPSGFWAEGTGDQTLVDCVVGSYSLIWGSVEGYVTPGPQAADLSSGETLTFTDTYAEVPGKTGNLSVDPNPDALNASWTVTGPDGFGTSRAGDQTLFELPAGEYFVSWDPVEGWEIPAPNPTTVLVEADRTVTVSGSYTESPSIGLPRVPLEKDWTDHGEIFAKGETGDWDLYFWGGFAGTAVKREGVYFLYYQGSNGYDDVEGTVTYRAIGVATSTDGINFTKYSGNPVLTWYPTNGLEEGAVSAGAWASADGNVNMYYGANTAISSSLVNADGRLATSSDGYKFVDKGLVIDHSDPGTWGYGDELFPVIGFQAGDKWITYYVPNGTPQKALLGVAWGSDIGSLPSTAQVRAGGSPVSGWGAGGWAHLSEGRVAILIQAGADAHLDSGHMDVYLVDPSSPASFSGPVVTYSFPNVSKSTFLLDRETNTWFLYYQNKEANAWGVRTAPMVLE